MWDSEIREFVDLLTSQDMKISWFFFLSITCLNMENFQFFGKILP